MLFDATFCQLPGHKLRKRICDECDLKAFVTFVTWLGIEIFLRPRANSLKKTRHLGQIERLGVSTLLPGKLMDIFPAFDRQAPFVVKR